MEGQNHMACLVKFSGRASANAFSCLLPANGSNGFSLGDLGFQMPGISELEGWWGIWGGGGGGCEGK